MTSGLPRRQQQQMCKRIGKHLCTPKPFLLFYLLLLTAICVAAVPQPGAKSRYGSLDLSHRENGQARGIILSSSERLRLRARQQDDEKSRSWNYPLYTSLPQMKGKIHNYRKTSHHRTRRPARRSTLSAEPTSEAEEAHLHEEEEGEHGHEEGDDEDESEEEEESEEEGGEEEHLEGGERDLSRVGTGQHPQPNEEIHYEGEHSNEITKTIRAAAEGGSGEAESAQQIGQKHTEEEMMPDIDDYQEPRTEEKPTTDEVSKNRNVFRGIPGGAVGGTNITHASLMVYKLVRANNIKTVVDIPCRNNLSWFPSLLERLDFEVVGFKYMCVDKGAVKDTQLRSQFKDAGSPEFYDIDPEHSEKLPKSDLVLSFDGPQQWGVRTTWSFFGGLRKCRPKYFIVTNNPGQKSNDAEHTLNLRKQPFHFTQPKRVISNVETEGNPKQLVFYDIENVREGF